MKKIRLLFLLVIITLHASCQEASSTYNSKIFNEFLSKFTTVDLPLDRFKIINKSKGFPLSKPEVDRWRKYLCIGDTCFMDNAVYSLRVKIDSDKRGIYLCIINVDDDYSGWFLLSTFNLAGKLIDQLRFVGNISYMSNVSGEIESIEKQGSIDTNGKIVIETFCSYVPENRIEYLLFKGDYYLTEYYIDNNGKFIITNQKMETHHYDTRYPAPEGQFPEFLPIK
jgi:hypothetical protein